MVDARVFLLRGEDDFDDLLGRLLAEIDGIAIAAESQ